MSKSYTIRDYKPETLTLVRDLMKAGFTIRFCVAGGCDKWVFNGNVPELIENLMACDDSHLYVTTPSGQRATLYLVYGNSPGELVCDCSISPELDAVLEKNSEKWAGRKQPMRTIKLPSWKKNS